MSYISALYQAFEDAVMNGGVHPDTGKDYREYVDLDSLAQCFLLLELSQCGDAFQSSTYFYKPAGEEKLYAGPLWDFDSAYGSYDANFPDVDPTLWYGPAVAWAAEKGVAQGFDGRFRPDDPITRQELVTILYRYGKTITPDLTAPEISGSYIDVGLVPAWAKEAFGWAIAAGVLTGNDDGTLNPQGLALRCQGAAMIQRFHETLNP